VTRVQREVVGAQDDIDIGIFASHGTSTAGRMGADAGKADCRPLGGLLSVDQVVGDSSGLVLEAGTRYPGDRAQSFKLVSGR